MKFPRHQLRLLLLLTAVLTAALCATALPEMKKILLLIPFALVALAFTSGCANGLSSKLAKMPDGRFQRATLKETGKFTHTVISLEGVTKDNGLFSADRISIDHTNPWVLEFHFEATGYEGQLTAATKKLVLPPRVLVVPPPTAAAEANP